MSQSLSSTEKHPIANHKTAEPPTASLTTTTTDLLDTSTINMRELLNLNDPFANEEKEFLIEEETPVQVYVPTNVDGHDKDAVENLPMSPDSNGNAHHILRNLSNTSTTGSASISKLKLNLDHVTQERNEARAEVIQYKEQMDILLQAIDLASKLASLDPGSYTYHHKDTHQEQKDCCPTTVQSQSPSQELQSPSPSPSPSPSTLQAQVDNLQDSWKLEETSIPNLMSSIHRLQSNITHLQTETDSVLPQNQLLQKDNLQYSHQMNDMKNAITKLYKDNVKLKRRLSNVKDKKRTLIQNVKQYLKRKEELDEEKMHMTANLQIHESALKVKKQCPSCSIEENTSTSTNAIDDIHSLGNGTETEIVGPSTTVINRQRSSTYDSAFSDISCDMGFSHEFENLHDPGDCDVSYSSSASSCSSFSLVTDECISTLRLASSSLPSASTTDGHDVMTTQLCKGIKRSSCYTLTIPSGVPIGLQFERVALNDEADVKTSRSRAFSDGVLHCRSIPENQAQMSKQIVSKTKIDKMFHTLIDRAEPSHSKLTNKVTNGYAFLVSGVKGFDTKMNIRPTIGAKLVAINDDNFIMRSDWTIDDLSCYLDANQAGKELSLTFRNEAVKKQHKDLLKKTNNNVTDTKQDVAKKSGKSENKSKKSKLRFPGTPKKKSSFMKSTSFFDKHRSASFFSSEKIKAEQIKDTSAESFSDKCSNDEDGTNSFLAKLKALDHKTSNSIGTNTAKSTQTMNLNSISFW